MDLLCARFSAAFRELCWNDPGKWLISTLAFAWEARGLPVGDRWATWSGRAPPPPRIWQPRTERTSAVSNTGLQEVQ